MTKLVTPIMVDDPYFARHDADRAAMLGAEMIELRVDRVAHEPPTVETALEGMDLPCILTCRPTWEGGEFEGDEAERLTLWDDIAEQAHPPAYLDVELAAWQHSKDVRDFLTAWLTGQREQLEPNDRIQPPRLILSTHDFTGRPTDLLRRLEAMASEPLCRVIKLAWRARSLRDNIEVFELLRQQPKAMIALCMGEFGVPSRLLAKKFNSLVTFAPLDEDHATAEGQVTLSAMKQQYRWDAINPATRVFGVIGYPLAHSMSPPLHNAGFERIEHDAVYLPMPVHAEYEQFKATVTTWLDAPGLHFGGASVTIPHKQNLLRFVSEQGGRIDPLSETIGAANTLVRLDDGALYACNTDYAAALDAVCDALGIERADLAERHVAVIGAGGAARAIVAGLAHYGASVVIYNRTVENAKTLADRFNSQAGRVVAAPLEKLGGACCDIFINCTPMGMHPATDQSPLPAPAATSAATADANPEHALHAAPPDWGPATLVFDTIYNPPKTKLLQQAEQAGCRTLAGVEMFIRQAAAQFQLWTGQPAPLDTFRRIMHERVGA